VKALHLQDSDTTGYAVLLQPRAARSSHQSAPGMQPLKPKAIEMANIVEAGGSFCLFENPSIQNPILLFATRLF